MLLLFNQPDCHSTDVATRSMMLNLLFIAACYVASASACADHTGRKHPLVKRQQIAGQVSPTNPSHITTDWAYDAPYNWGAIKPEYQLCHTGTQQSPVALTLTEGLSHYHYPHFSNYDRKVSGNWTNWGYGYKYDLYHPAGDYTTLPTLQWDNETSYLRGWHVHTPADHTVGGDRSKAELHLVHVNAAGLETAVVAVRLDPGTTNNAFFSQLPPAISYRNTTVKANVEINIDLILASANHFSDFWTYKGSLTSPPCREGLRWFIARNIVFTSTQQMRDILAVSTFSAREEQERWLHEVNGA